MRPKPWSFSALEDFTTCPKAYYEKKVVKSVVEIPHASQAWGTYVHAQFETCQRDRVPLATDVAQHAPLMERLARLPGHARTEHRVALTRTLIPTTFFAEDVWWRSIIDYHRIHGPDAVIVDYKTGKVKPKWAQLEQYAWYLFLMHPELVTVKAYFYWTTTRTLQGRTYGRDVTRTIWNTLTPALTQYVDAFRTDTWQTRPSGLCNGWCPVTDCRFWRPKRR